MSEQAARSRRLFFALWPTDELRMRLASHAAALVGRSGGRPIPARNLHVTLLFLGQVAAPQVEAVIRAGAAVRARASAIVFDQVETWPGANVLCLTSRAPPPALKDLSDQLRARASDDSAEHSFEFRQQAFRPHITLARNLRCTRSAEPADPVSWLVNEFALVESNMTEAGSSYSVQARWPLEH